MRGRVPGEALATRGAWLQLRAQRVGGESCAWWAVSVAEGVACSRENLGGVKGRAQGAWLRRGVALGGGAGRGHARGLRDRLGEGVGLPLSAAILATAEAGGFP